MLRKFLIRILNVHRRPKEQPKAFPNAAAKLQLHMEERPSAGDQLDLNGGSTESKEEKASQEKEAPIAAQEAAEKPEAAQVEAKKPEAAQEEAKEEDAAQEEAEEPNAAQEEAKEPNSQEAKVEKVAQEVAQGK